MTANIATCNALPLLVLCLELRIVRLILAPTALEHAGSPSMNYAVG